MDECPTIETNFKIIVQVPNAVHGKQILTYMDNLAISLTEAVGKLNVVSASCYKPTICIHHSATPENWATIKLGGHHKIINSTGVRTIGIGTVGKVRNQPQNWYTQEEDRAYTNAVENFNQGKL